MRQLVRCKKNPKKSNWLLCKVPWCFFLRSLIFLKNGTLLQEEEAEEEDEEKAEAPEEQTNADADDASDDVMMIEDDEPEK